MLSETGWWRADRLCEYATVFGIDREGELSTQDVRVSAAPSREAVVLIGTTYGLGQFAESTRLVLASGTVCRAGDLLHEIGLSEEVKFERAGVSRSIQLKREGLLESTASYLKQQSLVLDGDTAVIRAFGNPAVLSATTGSGVRLLGDGCAGISISALLSWGAGCSLDLLMSFMTEIVSRDGEEIAIPIWASDLALNLKDVAFPTSGGCFKYQSRQYSSVATILRQPENRSFVEALALCQTVSPDEQEARTIEWGESSWRPLCGGMILAP